MSVYVYTYIFFCLEDRWKTYIYIGKAPSLNFFCGPVVNERKSKWSGREGGAWMNEEASVRSLASLRVDGGLVQGEAEGLEEEEALVPSPSLPNHAWTPVMMCEEYTRFTGLGEEYTRFYTELHRHSRAHGLSLSLSLFPDLPQTAVPTD
jgi:hypothetical protein